MSKDNQVLEELTSKEYEHGWTTNIETDSAPKGLNEGIIRFISAKMNEPTWPNVHYPKINYQDVIYYSAPKQSDKSKKLEDIDPELIKTFEKLGISLTEQKRLTGIAVDAVIDSVSVGTTLKETLGELGIIFCSFSEAVLHHPELVKKYMGSVVPVSDNYFAALNSAVFTDGSFCYIPKG